jgi:DNA segregation ATPase FtsK/SpoIIIE, S-DNA-T family
MIVRALPVRSTGHQGDQRMRNGSSAAFALSEATTGIQLFVRRLSMRLLGLAILAGVVGGVASLGTWNIADPSFSHATDNPVSNAAGWAGAAFADIALQFFGLAALGALVPAVFWGFWLSTGRGLDRPGRRALAWFGSAVLGAAIAGCVVPPPTWPLPTGLGGVAGDMLLSLPALILGGYPTGWAALAIAGMLALPTGWLAFYGAGLIARDVEMEALAPARRRKRAEPQDEPDMDEDDEDEDERMLALGALVHWWLSTVALCRRLAARFGANRDPLKGLQRQALAGARREPNFTAGSAAHGPIEPDFGDDGDEFENGAFEERDDTFEAPAPSPRPQSSARIEAPAPRPVQGARVQREAQTSLIGNGGAFEMPTLHFLSEPKSVGRDPSLSKEALEQNARMLEGVLEDFGVKGEIIHVRPGPVVTLYELEPAPGIKSSRVIGLADDIARSMSAIACRVAVVPGRNAIGIELPNAKRETVYLREILASRDFEHTKAKLALALGKTINGEAVIADIAKMPHVLVAGTTGSGKSVAINTMILSILYRLKPEECRLIMIDPKMLELSVYDGIPHLLTPVVTDPKKAVVALKWTVREMEERYRKMSKVGVRNIDGFNQRVVQAEKKGETISRTVQTGFDRQTGEAIYETEQLDLEPMPYIVVIIDEMADLMMVAGKDIEGAVQRLAQMARAAGIHVIMATQRPSVDVITGTIKANFPTRISFQVTSKIDSRTILGEQGAEQLLGMGDMLYMAGGGRIQRVHGPFVSDDEVEKVVGHLKLQGVPEYLDAITEDDGDADDDDDAPRGGGGGGGNFDESDDPYDQAVSVVLRDGKASTSYIQRRLGIGYNRAASIIEKMEKEGIVGPANHAGKREILVPTEDEDPF